MIIVYQLNNLLKDSEARLNLASNVSETLNQMFGRAFARMKNFDQNNPHHCYDLLIHTLQTVAGLDRFCNDSEVLPMLRVAALFHDIGKPSVAQEKNGRSVFYGHAAKSAEISAPLLTQIGYSQDEVSLVLFYIAHHDDFISFKLRDEMPDKPNPYIKEINKNNIESQIKSTIRKCREMGSYIPSKYDYLNLMDLCCADASAQSEHVVMNGVCVDGSKQKIKRMKAIKKIIEELSVDKGDI